MLVMTTKRKLKSQIKQTENRLRQMQGEMVSHEHYFESMRFSVSPWMIVVFIVPAVWLGWRASKGRWLSSLTLGLSEFLVMSLTTFFRGQILRLVNQYLYERPTNEPKI